jgi:Uma2 family endonuclease
MSDKVPGKNDSEREIPMSQPAAAALAPLPFELVFDDGEPLETNWHRIQMNLLIHLIGQAMAERGRTDFFAGGNMFVYYSLEQARGVAREVAAGRHDRRHYRGPDVFFVGGVDGRPEREGWVVWEEGDRYPDLIVELLSPTTRDNDRKGKKKLYASVFKTPEYFLYDPDTGVLEGFRLSGDLYQPIPPNPQGRIPSEQLGAELGLWQGLYENHDATWVRLSHPEGHLVPTEGEAERRRAEAERQRAEAERQQAEAERQRAEAAETRAESERQRAEAERRRAEAAEAELARLRALLGKG